MASEQQRAAAATQRSAAAADPPDGRRGDVTPRQATDRPRSTRNGEPGGPPVADPGLALSPPEAPLQDSDRATTH